MEHFGAISKLDIREETRTQLQEEEAFASWLRLWLQEVDQVWWVTSYEMRYLLRRLRRLKPRSVKCPAHTADTTPTRSWCLPNADQGSRRSSAGDKFLFLRDSWARSDASRCTRRSCRTQKRSSRPTGYCTMTSLYTDHLSSNLDIQASRTRLDPRRCGKVSLYRCTRGIRDCTVYVSL